MEDLSHLAPAAQFRAPLLPTPFIQENFDFYGKTLTGTEADAAALEALRGFHRRELGEALGRKYVERTFGAEGKARTLKMVDALEKALGQDIEKLDWMTPETKAAGAGQAAGHHQQDRLS